MFDKLLVANRAEIAQRIFLACRELGVKSVAIYSDADANSAWVQAADEAYPLGGETAAESYLDQKKILAIAKRCGAQAIHPGYGFLSENAEFAAACAAHHIKFVGPSPQAMRLMGSKASSREIADKAGVPTPPGIDGAGKSPEQLVTAAEQIGYPILIKASAGGGGKGMRIVEQADQLADAITAARNEAQNSFGDDHILLERYFTEIHHIEIQVLGDEHGNLVHLFERECSIQRRHQKIIEETPSPTISTSTEIRDQIAAAAVILAKSVDYTSAGTVEFMYTNDGKFYLLEMNTRLQVEHPITEMVTGVDIAKWQIKIAAGHPLTFTQSDLSQTGHAIECRVYAEDPAQNFLPSINMITHCDFPQLPNLRVDSGIAAGENVTPFYDPMLAKVIVWGQDREEALARMRHALNQTVILGVTTNIPYLIDILDEPHFAAGETATSYLDTYFTNWSSDAQLDIDMRLAIAAYELLGSKNQTSAQNGLSEKQQNFDPWSANSGWRNV